jgi:hypothetical protein
MKLALRILVTALVAGLLAVPAASAKPGGGHGKGAEKARAAHTAKADKAAAKAAKKAEKAAKKAEKAAAKAARKAAKQAAKQAGQAEREEECEAAPSAAEVLGALFGSTKSACESEEEQVVQALEAPDLEGLGPGQYCHALEAWTAANGGNFATSFGTEGSGYSNDHGKCASRRAHGEDLAPAALQSVCDETKAAGGELPEACKPAEGEQAGQAAPASVEPSTLLRLLSF